MYRPRSLITLVSFIAHSFAMPLADDDDDDDWCVSDAPQPVQLVAPIGYSPLPVHTKDSPSAAILSSYELPPTPSPSHSQHPHGTLPVSVSQRSQTPVIVGAVFATVIAIAAFILTARYAVRRRRATADPFKDPTKPRFNAFHLRKSAPAAKRLSDESWVSPVLSTPSSTGSPLSEDHELRRYALSSPQRKPVPAADVEFGSGIESGKASPVICVAPVRVPSPVYFSPFSPAPSPTSSSSLSTDPHDSPSPDSARLSRLLFSTFRDTHVATAPARPTTAQLIQTARSYANAYRPSSAFNTSLYIQPSSSGRFTGTRSRVGFYPTYAGEGIRDTFTTVTTSDTEYTGTVPHLLYALSEVNPVHGNVFVNASPLCQPLSMIAEGQGKTCTAVGTLLGMKLRMSDASQHARYRTREKQRERARQQTREMELADERLSTASQTSAATATSGDTVRTVRPRSRSLEAEEALREFKLRDSDRILHEIGW